MVIDTSALLAILLEEAEAEPQVSTKAGTIMKLVSGGQRAAAEVRTSFEALESGSLRDLVRLVLRHEARPLFTREC